LTGRYVNRVDNGFGLIRDRVRSERGFHPLVRPIELLGGIALTFGIKFRLLFGVPLAIIC